MRLIHLPTSWTVAGRFSGMVVITWSGLFHGSNSDLRFDQTDGCQNPEVGRERNYITGF